MSSQGFLCGLEVFEVVVSVVVESTVMGRM